MYFSDKFAFHVKLIIKNIFYFMVCVTVIRRKILRTYFPPRENRESLFTRFDIEVLLCESHPIAALHFAISSNLFCSWRRRKLRRKIAAIPRLTILQRRVIKCKTTSRIADNTLIYSRRGEERGTPIFILISPHS